MPKCSYGCCNNSFDVFFTGDISRYSENTASTFPLDFLSRFFSCLSVTSSYRDSRPFCRECSRAGTSESFTCSQDQCYFLSESQVHLVTPLRSLTRAPLEFSWLTNAKL
jgi:hypothetical protein